MSNKLTATPLNARQRWLVLPWQGLEACAEDWPVARDWEILFSSWLQGLLELTTPISPVLRIDASQRWQLSPYMTPDERWEQQKQWARLVSSRFVLSGSVFVDSDEETVHLILRLIDVRATDVDETDLACEGISWRTEMPVAEWPSLEREFHTLVYELVSTWWMTVGPQGGGSHYYASLEPSGDPDLSSLYAEDEDPNERYMVCPLTPDATVAQAAHGSGFVPSLVHPQHVMRLSLGASIHLLAPDFLTLCEVQGASARITEAFQRISAEDPNCQWAWWLWGQHMARAGQTESAANATSYLLRGSWPVPNRARLALALGHYQALQGKTDRALLSWSEALSLDPSLAQAALNRAHTLESLNRLDEAIEAFHQLAEQHPMDLRAYYGLARLYSRLEQWELALSQYQTQSQLDTGDAWCLANQATCHLHLNQEVEAKFCLEKAVALDPDGEAGSLAQLVLFQLV